MQGNRVVLAAHNRFTARAVEYTVRGSYHLRSWQPLGTLRLPFFGPGTLGIGGLSHHWIRVDATAVQAPAGFDASVVFSAQ